MAEEKDLESKLKENHEQNNKEPQEMPLADENSPAPQPVFTESWIFQTGNIYEYLLNEQDKIYLIDDYYIDEQSGKESVTIKGVLRHEVKNVNDSAEILSNIMWQIFPDLSYYRSYKYPDGYFPDYLLSAESLEEILIRSADKKQETEMGKVTATFDHSESKDPAVQKQFKRLVLDYDISTVESKIVNYMLISSAIGLIGGGLAGGIGIGTSTGSAGYGLLAGLAAGIGSVMASMIAGTAVYCTLPQRICKKPSSDKILEPVKAKLRIHQETARNLKEKYEKAKTFEESKILYEQLCRQNEVLEEHKNLMKTAIIQKCASISFEETGTAGEDGDIEPAKKEAIKKVTDFFNIILSGENITQKALKSISEDTEEGEHKENAMHARAIIPVQTFGNITIRQEFTRDSRYDSCRDGRYTLKELIGEGGMGRVYRAIRKIDDKEVAIKFEKPETSSIRRKKELIKAIKGIKHDNLISITDANFDSDPAYTVMDYIHGTDLRKVLDFAKARNTKSKDKKYLSLENVLSIAFDLGNALAYLHSSGEHKKIVHNDIKPENILLDKNGKAYIGDCDIADVQADISSIMSQATSEKASGAGTFEYIAPERKNTKTKIDERSDIYSFGVLLYELVTGSLPITPDGLNKRTDLPQELTDFICKCTEIDPNERYSSMKDAINALKKININPEPLQLKLTEAKNAKQEIVYKNETTLPAEQAAQETQNIQSDKEKQ